MTAAVELPTDWELHDDEADLITVSHALASIREARDAGLVNESTLPVITATYHLQRAVRYFYAELHADAPASKLALQLTLLLDSLALSSRVMCAAVGLPQ